MKRPFLKRIQNYRVMSGLLIATVTILSFQNCAPPPAACDSKSGNCGSSKESGSSSNPSQSNNIWNNQPNSSGGGFAGGGGGGSSGSGGGSTFPGSGSGGGGAVNPGNGSGGGGAVGGGDSGGGSGSSQDTTFRVSTQPSGANIKEGQEFDLRVNVSGGRAPYTYQWYIDGKAISGDLGKFPFYGDIADSYRKQGVYHVEITEGSGSKIRSNEVRVSFIEPQVGCEKGTYYIFTNRDYDLSTNYFDEYFNGPRGKFLLHQSYDIYKLTFAYASYSGLKTYNTTANLAYMEKTYINCSTSIPHGIHTATSNPGGYDNSSSYTYQGSVQFECRNKKLKLIGNTCRWVYDPPPTPRGSDR